MKLGDFVEIQEAILADLYWRIMSDQLGYDRNNPRDVQLHVDIPSRLIGKALTGLEKKGFIELNTEEFRDEISASGIEYVEDKFQNEPSSIIAKYLEIAYREDDKQEQEGQDEQGEQDEKKGFELAGDDETVLDEKGIPLIAVPTSPENYLGGNSASPIVDNNEEQSIFPASDRVVSLKHNSPEYKEAVSSLEKVIQEFREDHHLDNELGHEKGALLKALEGGRELLDDTTINVRIGVALLVEPLKRIVEKYDQVLVGVSAAAALNIILKVLGLV